MPNIIRQKKSSNVATISDMYRSHLYVFVFNYSGLCAKDFFLIRKILFENAQTKMFVLKNTLHRIAASSLDFISPNLKNAISYCKGQNVVVFSNDPLIVSSSLKKYIDTKMLSFAFFSDKADVYDINELSSMAKYGNESGLKSAFVSMLSESYSRFARILNQHSSSM